MVVRRWKELQGTHGLRATGNENGNGHAE
jgi:hypothetical protein